VNKGFDSLDKALRYVTSFQIARDTSQVGLSNLVQSRGVFSTGVCAPLAVGYSCGLGGNIGLKPEVHDLVG